MKKCFSIFLIFAYFMFISSANVCTAISDDEITAPSAVLMEPMTGKILYEKNPHEIRACASITKVMTLLLVMEAIAQGKISLSDNVTVSEHAASMGGSDIWLEPGEVMTVDEMIKATVVASANDAAVALAEHICGTEDDFVENMNKKAAELGMKDTVFKNCNGLDEDGHLTSAYDVALMSRELIKHKKIYDYTSIWMDYLRDGKTQLVNTNKLLKSYNGITGLKTGTTSQAGSCISATARRNNLDIISVVLGSATGKDRFKDAAMLLDYGFANYSITEPILPEEVLEPVQVINGMAINVDVAVDLSGGFLTQKGKEKDITSKVEVVENIEAPVLKGQQVGKIIYSLDDEVLAEYPVVTVEAVDKLNFLSVFNVLLKKLTDL